MKAVKKIKPKPDYKSSAVVRETATVEYGAVKEIGAFEAKTHLASILDKVAHGQKFVVTKHGKPVAQIVPVEKKNAIRNAGEWRGRIWIADDFDAPLEDFKEYME